MFPLVPYMPCDQLAESLAARRSDADQDSSCTEVSDDTEEGKDAEVTYEEAQRYCGYASPEQGRLSGLGQFVLLLKDGLRPEHRVLEIGAGCLNLYWYLGKFCESTLLIEPNLELVKSVVPIPNTDIVKTSDDFTFLPGAKFDYIISHSVLSHASDSQLPQFMSAVAAQLAPGGVCLASIRLNFRENHDHWVYPEPRFFSPGQVWKEAGSLNLERREDYRELMISFESNQVHDWLRITL